MKKHDIQKQLRITIIIDVFRAFSTASYILDQHPASYILTTSSDVIQRLAKSLNNTFLVGKPEIGANLKYDIPNSPTRVSENKIEGKNVLHRTQGGAKGVITAKDSDIILVAGFVNAEATVSYIKKFKNPEIVIKPMGHEGTKPSLEDNLCASYIQALLKEEKFELKPYLEELRNGPGNYFFGDDQLQYPKEDFDLCLELERFKVPILAELKDDYANLTLGI